MDTNTQVKPVETPPAAKAKKPIYKRWWAIALAAVFVIGGISQAMGGGDDAKPVADSPPRVRRSRRSLSPRPRSRSRRLRRPHRLRRLSRSQHQPSRR